MTHVKFKDMPEKIALRSRSAIFGFRAGITLVIATMLSSVSLATLAAPVIDINDQGQMQGQQSGSQPSDEPADMFYQMQILQEEIRQLRGMLEEQAYQIRQLKQGQTENYSDLDGRISAITAAITAVPAGAPLRNSTSGSSRGDSSGSGSAENDSAGSTQQTDNTSSTDNKQGGDQQGAQYNAAYALLKARKLEESLLAFQDFTAAFPTGSYTPNAYYWMGEIHLVKNRLNEAAVEFNRVVENYPTHRKALDARYKLGTVYYQLGDKEKARKHLETAAAGNGSGARLAQRYLEANF